jgi:hypothetical protein
VKEQKEGDNVRGAHGNLGGLVTGMNVGVLGTAGNKRKICNRKMCASVLWGMVLLTCKVPKEVEDGKRECVQGRDHHTY